VEWEQFSIYLSENPNGHLHKFLAKCDTIKLRRVSTDDIRLLLFPFSLRDRASDWLQHEEPNSFTTWETLSKAFLSKYFSPDKTAKLRNDITSFAQREGEFLYKAWERFKDLQQQCSHHGVPNWLLVQTFYNGLEQSVKISVDAVPRGALIGKSIEAAKALLEEMTSNNYHLVNDRATLQRSGDKYTSRVDALAQRLKKFGTFLTPGRPSRSSVGVYAVCETCSVQGHTSAECYNGSSTIEHTNALQGFHPHHSILSSPLPTTRAGKVTLTPL